MTSFFKSVLKMFIFMCLFFIGMGFLIDKSGCSNSLETTFNEVRRPVKENSILVLDLEGVIIDGSKFLKTLETYSKKDDVKAIVIRVNSPGGVVGPSQEIYSELKRVRDVLKKPVIMACNGVAASGAYYASMGANLIYTNPGTLMGSIGVIMEFANMSKLFEWAKFKPFSITSGKMKSAGASYKEMNADERLYFQGLIDEVYRQFSETVKTERKVSQELMDAYGDGRVFNGKTAVELGFADQVGTYKDALDKAAELAEIEGEPNLIIPKDRPKRFYDLLSEAKMVSGLFENKTATNMMKLMGKPLMIIPGTIPVE